MAKTCWEEMRFDFLEGENDEECRVKSDDDEMAVGCFGGLSSAVAN